MQGRRIPGYAFEGWYLWQRPDGRFYANRFDPARGQVKRIALGTAEPEQAAIAWRQHIAQHAAIRNARPEELTVAEIAERYWLQHGQHLASADVTRRSLKFAVEHLGDLALSDLTRGRQEAFIAALRARGHCDGYIRRTLVALRAAINWAHRREEVLAVPHVIAGEVPDSPDRQRVLTHQEVGAFFAAIDDEVLANFVLVGLNTGARPGAILDLQVFQIDLARRRINLNPAGRQQTKKGRPILPITNTLYPVLNAATGPYIVPHRLKWIRNAWAAARTRSGLEPDVVPTTLRHTVATWLHEHSVPDGQISDWLGHRHAHRTTARYIKSRVYRPDYLAEAAAAIDAAFSAIETETGRVWGHPTGRYSPELGVQRTSNVPAPKLSRRGTL